ncbi:MAG: SCP2 sterol-binding domain-containing protein [Clostridiales bacterium]|nr:SCP2 sterol-binding domain-containing protein [Clostridiales bacterium]
MVTTDFASIYKGVKDKVSKASFSDNFVATQITIDESSPLYVRVEDKIAEVAPYEYNDASFYIDSSAQVFADILNGKKDIYNAIADGSVRINGDAAAAVLFIRAVF